MAKIIYVCERSGSSPHLQRRIGSICRSLKPDHIDPPTPLIKRSADTIYGVINPGPEVEERGPSLLVGTLFGASDLWERPGAPAPDGCYALFRDDGARVEVVSDPAVTNIWYYFDDERLICSTSQRAIITYLGSFEFNSDTVPWVMSTGGLGPGLSWDRRLKLLPPDSSILLDRQDWSLTLRSSPIVFEVDDKPDHRHQEELKGCLDDVFSALELDLSQWTITLSGGVDSRGVLTFLGRNQIKLNRLRSASWGTSKSQHVPNSDPFIAAQLAKTYGLPHQFFALDAEPPPIDLALHRFLEAGEGRIDHFSAYTDGFELWKTLFDTGQRRLIRGDEGFDIGGADTALRARLSAGLGLCTDFSNLADYQRYGLPAQIIPAHLRRHKNESPSTWHTRLHHQYQLPIRVGALATLKSGYGDQINPLLSRKILHKIRTLPDHLRRQKKVFRALLAPLAPPLPLASQDGVLSKEVLFQQPSFQNLIAQSLRSPQAGAVLPQELVSHTLQQIERAIKQSDSSLSSKKRPLKQRLTTFAKNRTPRQIKNMLLGRVVSLSINPALLGFRLLLISEMNAQLSAAALHVRASDLHRAAG